MQIGYCGNVHPGRTLEEVKQNLITHTLEVKNQVRGDGRPMGVGLWLSASASHELESKDKVLEFKDWLEERGLLPFTFNGFPYGDFHQEVVKQDVYLPTWAMSERLDYTVGLAEVLNQLLPEGVDGTISTLPLGWPIVNGKSNVDDELFWKSCARNLLTCAERLDNIQQLTGRNIFICIEPEPGCILDTWDDIVGFFDQHLFTDSKSTDLIRKHIGVCHDICHSAVMFEEQGTAVTEYKKAGIKIGKVQVSSAVAVDFEGEDSSVESADQNKKKMEQLKSFAEPKYLHQTSVRLDAETKFYEDLQLAIDDNPEPRGTWNVHFHVPIFSETLDLIGTSQNQIEECLSAIKQSGEPMPHFEVETYAWNVLPKRLWSGTLADGIAKEVIWFEELVQSLGIERS